MTQLSGRRLVIKFTALFLVFLLSRGNLSASGQEVREEQLEGLFQWAVMDYQNGKYRQVARNVEPLLSYFEEQNSPGEEKNGKRNILKGKIHLLLGATYEKMGNILKARSNYQLAHALLAKGDITIEEIDFSSLEEYRRIIKGNRAPVADVSGTIEKPALKKKKRSLATILVLSGAAVVVGVIAAVLLKKKEDESRFFDTYVMGISWMQISEGNFRMGDNYNEGEPDERPMQYIWMDEYNISRYEVTFAQYDYFCQETQRQKPSDSGWGRGDLPVINVSWEDATAFCDWLADKTGKNIHLPSEAQWEKAARGTNGNRYPWGNSPPDCYNVNYNCNDRTKPVNLYLQGISIYNVYNMAGNVSEWCGDVYDPQFYSRISGPNPFNAPQGNINVDFVIRGGSWDSSQNLTIRCADRGHAYYNEKSNTIGFRLVRESK